MAMVVTGCVLANAGCYSEFPLDATPQVPVSKGLLGKWTCRSSDSDNVAELDVSAADSYRYRFSWRERSRKAEHFEAFASVFGTGTLVNVTAVPREDSGWPHPWAFVAVDVSSNVLRVQLAGEEALTGNERSSEEVRNALAKAAAGPEFLGEPLRCDRK